MLRPLALALFILACLPAAAQDGVRTISVTGEGQVTATPDMATLTLGAMTEAETASDALRQNSAAVSATLEVLKEAGVAPRDIQTSGLTLSPRRDRPEMDRDTPPEIVGYRASNTVTVRVRDLDALGTILDAAVSEGANTLGGISFGLTDPQAAEEAARRDAVADALARAALYADAAGVTLGPLRLLTEEGGGGPGPMMMRAEAMSDSAVPIAAGELTLSARVRMEFGIAD